MIVRLRAARHVAVLVAGLAAAACSHSTTPAGVAGNASASRVTDSTSNQSDEAGSETGYDKIGVASWYGRRFHGRRTASGEIYDMNDLTAAHRSLPLSSVVRVTNLDNGRELIVRVNDRGPYAGKRIIDLSRAGARALGFEEKGVAKVRVTVLREAPDQETATTSRWPLSKRSPPTVAAGQR